MFHSPIPSITLGSRRQPSLLLLHGFMGCKEDWITLLPVLAEHFYCVAIDLPGHGAAAAINWSFAETVDYLIMLQQEISPNRPSHLWGYSMGGRLALAAALKSPVAGQQIILESVSLGLSNEAAREQRRQSDRAIARKLQRPDLDFAAFLHHWYTQCIFTGLVNTPGFAQMIERRLAGDPIGYACALEKLGLGQQPYFGEQLAQWQQPILAISGALDRKFVAIGQEMVTICPATHLEVLANCSHNVHAQQPQKCLDLAHNWLLNKVT